MSRDLNNVVDFVDWLVRWLRRRSNSFSEFVVFDIDDTCIHHSHLKGISESEPEPLMRFLYDAAVGCGFSVFFVTARPFSEFNFENTLHQLKKFGFTHFDGLYLLPVDIYRRPGFNMLDVATFKTNIRNDIKNFCRKTNVLNVGNLWTDLVAPANLTSSITEKKGCVVFRSTDPSEAVLNLKLPETKQDW